jgi:hypothetical protein
MNVHSPEARQKAGHYEILVKGQVRRTRRDNKRHVSDQPTLRRRPIMPMENTAIVHRLYEEVWNNRRLELLDELLSPSHALQAPNVSGSEVGPQFYKRQILVFLKAFSDLRNRRDLTGLRRAGRGGLRCFGMLH